MTTLHDERALELVDLDMFLCKLRARFDDPTQTQQMESEVRNVKQGSRSIAEYIRKFRKIMERLRNWPEQLLTQYFREGINHDLFHFCLVRGILDQLNNLY